MWAGLNNVFIKSWMQKASIQFGNGSLLLF